MKDRISSVEPKSVKPQEQSQSLATMFLQRAIETNRREHGPGITLEIPSLGIEVNLSTPIETRSVETE